MQLKNHLVLVLVFVTGIFCGGDFSSDEFITKIKQTQSGWLCSLQPAMKALAKRNVVLFLLDLFNWLTWFVFCRLNDEGWFEVCVWRDVCTLCLWVLDLAGTHVLSFKALLSTKTPFSGHQSGHSVGRCWNVHLCICWNWVQLSLHTQCLASVHVSVHRVLTARQKTATQRYDRFISSPLTVRPAC